MPSAEHQTCFLGVSSINGIKAKNDEGQKDHGCKDDNDDPTTDIDVFNAPYHTHLDVGPAAPLRAAVLPRCNGVLSPPT